MLFVETLVGVMTGQNGDGFSVKELFVETLIGAGLGLALAGVLLLFRYMYWLKNVRSTPEWNKIHRKLWLKTDEARRAAAKGMKSAAWDEVYEEHLMNFARSHADVFGGVEENERATRFAQLLSNLFFNILDTRFDVVEHFTLVARDKKLLCVLEGEVLNTDSVINVVSQTEITESFITPLWMSIMDKILQQQMEEKL